MDAAHRWLHFRLKLKSKIIGFFDSTTIGWIAERIYGSGIIFLALLIKYDPSWILLASSFGIFTITKYVVEKWHKYAILRGAR